MVFRAVSVAAFTCCALLAADMSAAGAESSGRPVYAVTDSGTEGRLLTRRNPETLEPMGSSARLGSSSEAAAFSPNGSLLAFVEWGNRPSVHILNLSRMRWRAQVPLGLATGTVILRWLDSSHVLVFAERPDGLRVSVLDTTRNRLSVAKRIAGHLSDRPQVAVSRTRAAVLIRAVQRIGSARIAVVSSSGSARIVTLKQIREGAIGHEIYRPSLVADPTADQAYVVGAIREPVATINLRTLTVSYRRPLASAAASDTVGADRMTAWLGGGRFAVAGWDDGTMGSDTRLLGLRVLDTHSWRARTLDPDVDFVCIAGHSLVGHHLDGTLVVFGFDGVRRLALSPLDAPAFPAPVASNDRYLYLPDPGAGALVADLASRSLIGRLPVQGLSEVLSPTNTLGAGCR